MNYKERRLEAILALNALMVQNAKGEISRILDIDEFYTGDYSFKMRETSEVNPRNFSTLRKLKDVVAMKYDVSLLSIFDTGGKPRLHDSKYIIMATYMHHGENFGLADLLEVHNMYADWSVLYTMGWNGDDSPPSDVIDRNSWSHFSDGVIEEARNVDEGHADINDVLLLADHSFLTLIELNKFITLKNKDNA